MGWSRGEREEGGGISLLIQRSRRGLLVVVWLVTRDAPRSSGMFLYKALKHRDDEEDVQVPTLPFHTCAIFCIFSHVFHFHTSLCVCVCGDDASSMISLWLTSVKRPEVLVCGIA